MVDENKQGKKQKLIKKMEKERGLRISYVALYD